MIAHRRSLFSLFFLQVFVASALMEWHHDNSNVKVPKNIFELGAKRFMAQPGFVLAYIDFQLGLGDTANARATFERALTVTPAPQAPPLWDTYLQFESKVSGRRLLLPVTGQMLCLHMCGILSIPPEAWQCFCTLVCKAMYSLLPSVYLSYCWRKMLASLPCSSQHALAIKQNSSQSCSRCWSLTVRSKAVGHTE